MKSKMWLLGTVLTVAVTTAAQGQVYVGQPVVYQQPAATYQTSYPVMSPGVVYQSAPAVTHMAHQAAQTAGGVYYHQQAVPACCPPVQPPPCPPPPVCPPNVCDPVFRCINRPECCGKTDCTKIDNPMLPPKANPPTIKVPFYVGTPKKGKLEVEIPVLQSQEIEDITFCRKTIDFVCCELDVCVPDQRCITKLTKCELVKTVVDVEYRIRRDGCVDVYVLGVAGMPKEWILKLGISKADVKVCYKVDL